MNQAGALCKSALRGNAMMEKFVFFEQLRGGSVKFGVADGWESSGFLCLSYPRNG